MTVVLDGKRFISSLVQRAGTFGLPVPMPPFAVDHLKPAHEFDHLAISGRPDDEMKVVGHHAVREKSYRRSILCLLKGAHERSIGRCVLEDRHPTDTAIQHVKNHTCAFVKPTLWHGDGLFNSLASRIRRPK